MKKLLCAGWVVVLVGLAGLLGACGVPSQAEHPGRVEIDELSVQILESFPVQVEVVILGTLPDSCTKIQEVGQRYDAERATFSMSIETERSEAEACAQTRVPFDEKVTLDVYGLPAGTYTVDVEGVRETFTLAVDNAPSEAELPNPASLYCQEQGFRVEIRTDDEGNQHGVCIFPDGSECDEWAFFRGECGPTGRDDE